MSKIRAKQWHQKHAPFPKWSRMYGGWETGYYFYNNSSGITVTNRPYDFGQVKKRRTGRKTVRKRGGRPMTPEEEDAENNMKPQPLIELEAAWSMQRLVRRFISKNRVRLKRADRMVNELGRKTTEGWITYQDPICKFLYGKFEHVYININTRRVVWTRTYETTAEKYAREKREAQELLQKLNTSMMHYGRLGDVHEARKFVRQGANMYYLDEEHGCTLAHFAASRSLMNVLQWLEKESFNFNFRDKFNATALHHAAKSGDTVILEYLLKRPNVNIEAKDTRGRTPVLWAAFGANVENIDTLRDHGADIHAMDNAGCNAVHRAANSPISGYRKDTVKWLHAEGLDLRHKDHWGWTPMNKAYTCKTNDVVEELNLHGCHVTVHNSFEKIEGWQPVHVAAMQGRVDALMYLEKRGCDLDIKDKRDETPLHLAAANNKVDAVKYLLRRGCATNTKNNIGQTPKDLALRMEYNEVVDTLNVVEERLARVEAKKKREKEKAREKMLLREKKKNRKKNRKK